MKKTNSDCRVTLLETLKATLAPDNPASLAFENCLQSLISLADIRFESEQLPVEFLRCRASLIAQTTSIERDAGGHFRTALIEAEYHRLKRSNYRALEQYEIAIECAESTNRFLEAALTAELTACFYIDWDRSNHAVLYCNKAHDLYQLTYATVDTNFSVLTDAPFSPASSPTCSTVTSNTLVPTNLLTPDNQTNYRQLVENAADVIWSTDKNGRFTYLSPQWKSLTGYEVVEGLGKNSLDYVHAGDLPYIKHAMGNLYRGSVSRNKEFRHLCADGTYTWVMVASTAISDENGNITGMQGILRDISENKELELALQSALKRLQHLTENLPCVIIRHTFSKNEKYNLLYIGPQCEQLFEIDAEAALLNPELILQRVNQNDLQQNFKKISENIESESLIQIEYRVTLPRKGQRWYQSTYQPTRLSNEEFSLDGIITDITEKKLIEIELQQANSKLARAGELKDAFLANMNHELKTPLTAIMSTNEGLQSGMLGPRTSEQLEGHAIIQESSNHLLALINDLLDLSDIEAVSAQLNISNIDISNLCQSCFRLVSPLAGEKSVRLHLHIPVNIYGLKADEKRLRQILTNLLQNAIKFTPDGGKVTLSASRFKCSSSNEDCIRFSVTDNGIGIDESNACSIFEPFHQVQSTLNRHYDGMGLGLAIAKRYVELHSGHISVKSTVGEGSRFNVDLPISDFVAPAEKLNTNSPAELTNQNKNNKQISAINNANSRPSILLAEDNDAVANAITKYLEFSGYLVNRSTDGESALQMASKAYPDVVLMDIQMPGVDGLEAIKRMRRKPQFEHTPIIALTGLAGDEDEQRCIDAGANYYLSKPYRMQTLVDLLGKIAGSARCMEATELH